MSLTAELKNELQRLLGDRYRSIETEQLQSDQQDRQKKRDQLEAAQAEHLRALPGLDKKHAAALKKRDAAWEAYRQADAELRAAYGERYSASVRLAQLKGSIERDLSESCPATELIEEATDRLDDLLKGMAGVPLLVTGYHTETSPAGIVRRYAILDEERRRAELERIRQARRDLQALRSAAPNDWNTAIHEVVENVSDLAQAVREAQVTA